MRDVQVRAVNEIERITKKHPAETVAIVSHADLIKMVLAHYLGMHLDNFQRIMVSPASISILMLAHSRPFVVTMNDMGHLASIKQDQHHG